VLAVNGYSQSFLTNGLAAYYPFNGNANDASGGGKNGTVYGATLTPDRFGNANQAYLFGGTAYITVPFNSAFFSNDFTASVWFNAYDINNSWPTLLGEVGNTAFLLGIAGQTSGAYPQNIGDLFAYALIIGANFSSACEWPCSRASEDSVGPFRRGCGAALRFQEDVAVARAATWLIRSTTRRRWGKTAFEIPHG
jgi:hypothetical protein